MTDTPDPAAETASPPLPPLPPPPARPHRQTGCVVWFLLATTLFLGGVTVILLLALAATQARGIPARAGRSHLIESHVSGDPGRSDKVLLVPVVGIILDGPSEYFGGGPGLVQEVQDMLQMAREDKSVRAVLLSIDSPGGGVTASDVLYHEIKVFEEETGKPVVALLNDVAASGGYYVAAAADYIVAHRTTLTGSIGVVLPQFGAEGLLEKIGVSARPVKSGAMKDIGSMFRPQTSDETRLLQAVVDENHAVFTQAVKDGFERRETPLPENFDALCDGRIFSGAQAKAYGFVDEIGYFADAVAAAAEAANLSADAVKVTTYVRRPTLIETLLGAKSPSPRRTMRVRLDAADDGATPRMMYLWTGAPTPAVRVESE